MIAALESQFWIQRLGWTLLHFLWQGTVIAVAYAMLRSLLKRSLPAQGRYLLAVAALLVMAAAPPLTFLLLAHARGSAPRTFVLAAREWLLPGVVALWLLGVVAFSIRLLGGWRFTTRLRSTAHPAPAEWRRTLERISVRVGVRRAVRLLISSLVNVPTVIGWLRPTILVPVEFLTGSSVAHITALLAHELAHVRRADYLTSILQGVIESVLFYHPAVWWISEELRAERELCCDDLAVAATGDVLAYARALAELESRQPARLIPALAANGGSLVNRVRRLIEPAQAVVESSPGPGTAWAMTVLWLAGVALASIHGSVVSSSKAPVADVVNRSPNSEPAPSPAMALASKARNVLLYDPLLATHPPTLPGDRPQLRAEHRENRPDFSSAAVFVPAPDLSGSASRADSNTILPPPAASVHLADVRLPAPPSPSLRPISPEEPPGAPMFRADAFRAAPQMIQVDVIARHKGAPAIGLIEQDFSLLDERRPQRIASFTVTSRQTSGSSCRPLPAGVVSNRLECGGSLANAVVLLIDQRNAAHPGPSFALQRVVKFLRARRHKSGTPDRMGLYTLDRDGLRVVQEITDDAELLRRAAESLGAQTPRYRSPNELVPVDTKHALESIARHLASVPGRKALVWVSSNLPLDLPKSGLNPDLEDAARALTDANAALYLLGGGSASPLSEMNSISNAELSGFEPAESRTLPFAPLRQTAPAVPSGVSPMSLLADLTGGLALYDSNGIENLVQHALEDSELTYTLGFYPAVEEQESGWRKLRVEVAKPGVAVRFRTKYFAPGALAHASSRPSLPDLLNAPLDATQMQVSAETAPDQARPDFRRVRAVVDLHDVHLENRNHTWAGAVDISFFMAGSATAKVVTRNLEIPDQQLAAALQRGIVVDDSIGVSGQAGELRIVAQDRTTGAAGSVRVPLVPQ